MFVLEENASWGMDAGIEDIKWIYLYNISFLIYY
jgi:hypothetical protein